MVIDFGLLSSSIITLPCALSHHCLIEPAAHGCRSNAFKRIVAHLPAEDRAKLFFGNAARVYRLGEKPKA